MAKYKNAPIQEAICEFQFVPESENTEWDLTLPGKLQLQDELSDYSAPSRQQKLQTISATNIKGQPDLAVSDILFRVQLPTKDGRAMLSIGNHVLAVSVFRPYEGWQDFRPRTIKALGVYTRIASQSAVRRIGLRYVNRIITPLPETSQASRFFTGVETTLNALEEDGATQIDAKLTAMNTRHEFETIDGIKVLVTHATITPAASNTSEYLLDIDIVSDNQIIDGSDKIVAVLDKLHAVEGGVFEALITDEARRIFNES